MKLSSISLVGAALATIVVSAIAASVPRSDGGLVDSLFTRENEQERITAAHTYQLMAAAHGDAMTEHARASHHHRRAGEQFLHREEPDESVWYFAKADQHAREVRYHDTHRHLNSGAALAASTEPNLTAEHCQTLITYASNHIRQTELCKQGATRSKRYAKKTKSYLNGRRPNPGPFIEPMARHRAV